MTSFIGGPKHSHAVPYVADLNRTPIIFVDVRSESEQRYEAPIYRRYTPAKGEPTHYKVKVEYGYQRVELIVPETGIYCGAYLHGITLKDALSKHLWLFEAVTPPLPPLDISN